MTTKVCIMCKKELDISNFSTYKTGINKGYSMSYCVPCNVKRVNAWRHLTGRKTPLNELPSCASYLGVYIAETVLAEVFNAVERTPTNTKGYDFVCGKGYKIDAKSGCTEIKNGYKSWRFDIRKNKTPDYFICLAFDNRANLTPLHIWIIPGDSINNLVAFRISESKLDKWNRYEQNNNRDISTKIKCIVGEQR